MPAQREEKKGPQLQRGSACLSCRRRKIRCNGDRPYCRPCIDNQRLHECNYDDHRKKSRTQALREKVNALEMKLAELEANSQAPQVHLQAAFFNDSPVTESSTPLTSNSPFESQSPEAFGWKSAEVQGLDTSSPLNWPNPIASDRWATSSPYERYDSNLLPPRQTTPISTVCISPETQQYLLNTFIAHRAQCHFYSNVARFQSISLQQLEEQPHPALLQAITLMGCYFSRDPQLRCLETDLLKQSLHEISVSLRDCEHLSDVVQASSLLALYCYFNGRFVEGYRHAFVAARLAVALKLHQLPYPCQEYFQNYGAYYDRVVTFWQVYMVDRAWSGVYGILAALSEDESRGQITTPMMWTSDPTRAMEPLLMPNYLYSLLDHNNSVTPRMDAMSIPALKALASAIFYRTFHSVIGREDNINPATHSSVLVAVQRIQTILPPFVGRENRSPQAPHVDVELLAVHTMLKVVELKFSEEYDNRVDGDAKMLWAVDWFTRSIEELAEDDYLFLDPLIAGIWNQGAKLLIKKVRQMKGLLVSPSAHTLNPSTRGMPSAVTFVDRCVDVLFHGLRSLSSGAQVAADYVESLEQEYLPHGRTVPLESGVPAFA